ncbi:hypothetical protein A4G18_01940 [Pasteurellaceae bacterium Pebbles2]|nr:hypothetical protein [Pasteurellaceae bacterium Pebbles2]
MNKIFKIIWNQATQSFVAVSELSKARGKTSSVTDDRATVGALSVAAATALAAFTVSPAMAATVIGGSTAITSTGAGDATSVLGGKTITTSISTIGFGENLTASSGNNAERTSVLVGEKISANRSTIAVGNNITTAQGTADPGLGSAIVVGYDNKLDNPEEDMAIGYNITVNSEGKTAKGRNANDGRQNMVLGRTIDVNISNNANVIGANLTVRNVADSFVGGNKVNLTSAINSAALGWNSKLDNVSTSTVDAIQSNLTWVDQSAVKVVRSNITDSYLTTVIGSSNNVSSTRNSVIIGSRINVGDMSVTPTGSTDTTGTKPGRLITGAVILGDESSLYGTDSAQGWGADGQAAKDTNSATVNGTTYSGFAGRGVKDMVVSVGARDKERQIKNVAAGVISETSTDAINGSQLYLITKGLQDKIEAIPTDGTGSSTPLIPTLPDTTNKADPEQPGVQTGTTNQAAPTNIGDGADKTSPNTAATVADILNEGWNLQENGAPKDFVKPYDIVNFNNGANTIANITMSADALMANVTYSVTGLPITYTAPDGTPVAKVGDKFYTLDDKGNPTTTEVAAGDLSTNLVNPAAAPNEIGAPTTLGNVASGTNTLDGAKDENGAPLSKVGDKYYKPSDLDEKGQPKADAAAVEPTTPASEDSPYAGLADLNSSNPNNAATVGDLKKMGWVVSANGNDYSDDVRNANEVKFNGKNGIEVTGETDANGVRNINISIAAGEVIPSSDDQVSVPAGSVKGADGNYYAAGDLDADGKPNTGAKPVTTTPIVRGTDGNYYAPSDLDANGKPNAGATPVPADQVVAKPNSSGANFVTGNAVGDAIQKSGFTVGHADKGAINDKATEFKTGAAAVDEKVNPNDELRFADGNGTVAQIATVKGVNKDGKEVTTTTVKFDVATTELHTEAPTAPVENTSTNPAGNTVTTKTEYSIDPKTGVVTTTTTTTETAPDGTVVNTNVNQAITRPGQVLPPAPGEGDKLVNATTVANAINNSGWGIQADGEDKGLVKPSDKVNFTSGNGTTASIETDPKTGVTSVKYDAKVDGTTIKFDKDGNISANTSPIAAAGDDGVVKAPASPNALATAGDVVKAVNSAGHRINSEKHNNQVVSAPSKTGVKVKAGDTVTYAAGKNLEVAQDGHKVTYGLSKEIAVEAVTVGTDSNPANNVQINNNGISAGNKKITNVARGTAPTDAVNLGQLKDEIGGINNRINKVDKGLRAGIAGAMAAGNLYHVTEPGKSMVSAGVGTYRGEGAMAVGYSRLSDNGKIGVKFSVNSNTRGDSGAAASVGYQW